MNKKMLVVVFVCISSFVCAADTKEADDLYIPSCATINTEDVVSVKVEGKNGHTQYIAVIEGNSWVLNFTHIKKLCVDGHTQDVKTVLEYMYEKLWNQNRHHWKHAASLNKQKYGFTCDFTSDAIIAAALKECDDTDKKA